MSDRLIRPCLAHAGKFELDPTREAMARMLAIADECADCLTVDPATGEWVTCPSTAAPASPVAPRA